MSFDAAAALREVRAGNEAYARSDFGAAVAAYERALATGADSADLHYNLGNAYYRAGRLGNAALAYERALRREPGDADARANLAVIRDQSRDQVLLAGQEPFLLRVGSRTPPELAVGLLLAAWIAACAALIARQHVERALPRLVLLVVAVGSLLAAGASGVATFAAWDVRRSGEAVVLDEEVFVLEAPRADATRSFEIHEGLKVRAVSREAGYTRIELPNGLSGWVVESSLSSVDQEE